MNGNLSLDTIVMQSKQAFHELSQSVQDIPNEKFFAEPPNGKWSIAQHVKHLLISTKTTTAAYALPRFIVRLVAGKPNRPSRTYEDLVEKYKTKLAMGGKASGRYIPAKIKSAYGKENLLRNWERVTAEYLRAMKTKWKDDQLDNYIVPHPLLGKITLRELGYFTIYHTYHHMNSIRIL